MLKKFLKNKSSQRLLLGIIVYIIVFTSLSFLKYINYSYNALDLAIFNQTFFHNSFGSWFTNTIHPPSYLGDHFIPLMVILTPLYSLWKSPMNLLFWQSIILALSAIPLYLIGKKLLKPKLLILLVLVFLLNPFLQNANLFEFHFLAFLPFLFLFTFYFYQQKKFKLFLLFFVLSLFIREDISFVMIIFGFLALIEKRSVKWILTPIILSVLYFLGAMFIIQKFAPAESYKFMVYYSWLGNTPIDMLKHFFTDFLAVIKHIFSIGTIEMIIIFIIGFCFIPIFKPKYLLFAILPFLQITLGEPSGSTLINNTHYGLLFVPGLTLAFIYALKLFSDEQTPKYAFIHKLKRLFLKEKRLSIMLLIVCSIYACLSLGPLYKSSKEISQGTFDNNVRIIKDHLAEQVPKDANLATSSGFLSNLSSRKNLSLLRYAYIGKKQFGQGDFQLPEGTEYLLVDSRDYIIYDNTFKKHPLLAEFQPQAANQFRQQLLSLNLRPVEIIDRFSLWQKTDEPGKYMHKTFSEKPAKLKGIEKNLADKIIFLGYQVNDYQQSLEFTDYSFLPISFYWQALVDTEHSHHLLLEAVDENNQTILRKLQPLAGGIYPAKDWPENETMETKYNFLLPKIENQQDVKLLISLVEIDGGVETDGLKSAVLKVDQQLILGEKIELGNYQDFIQLPDTP